MANSAPTGTPVLLSQLGSTTTRALNASDITDPTTQFYWDPANGGNGHIYEVIQRSTGFTFNDALNAAQERQLAGLKGYLVTITSQGEDNFISSVFNDPIWLNATNEGRAGDISINWVVAYGSEVGFAIDYYNWLSGEPNGSGDKLIKSTLADWGGKWDDIAPSYSGTMYGGYLQAVAEYSGNVILTVPDITASGPAFTQGRTLYADASQITDPDGIGTISWQWQRSNDNGATWSDISNATSRSYTLTSADVGKLVRSEGIYVDGGGTLERVFSAAAPQIVSSNQAPIITSNGGADSARIAMLENATAVTTVVATDADLGTTLRYGIVGGADASMFSINATTGALRFKSTPDFESPKDNGLDNVYDVVVQVSDGSLTDRQSITVTVQDIANELLVGTSRADTLTGAGGNDTLKGSGGNDKLYGNGGDDVLDGGKGADRMEGGSGNDIYIVDNASDLVIETTGTDTVKASVSYALAANVENLALTGSANLGGRGNDSANIITGNAGANILMGFAGNDSLKGGAGSDTLYGDDGKDVLTGGAGQDFFVFDTAASAANVDKITDFNFGDNDKVQLSKAVFTGFTHLGSLTSDEFYAAAGATKAHDSTDRVIYDTTSGKLYYDADGQGGAAAVQIAVLGSSSHPVMIYSDIQIIA